MGMMGECIKQLSLGIFLYVLSSTVWGVIAGLMAATIALPNQCQCHGNAMPMGMADWVWAQWRLSIHSPPNASVVAITFSSSLNVGDNVLFTWGINKLYQACTHVRKRHPIPKQQQIAVKRILRA